jgi:hypothetical protein
VGDLEEARLLLDTATRSVALWGETSWRAAVVEAAATVAMAEGDAERAGRLAREAADAYTSVGQPQDAARVLASAYAG